MDISTQLWNVGKPVVCMKSEGGGERGVVVVIMGMLEPVWPSMILLNQKE